MHRGYKYNVTNLYYIVTIVIKLITLSF